MTEVLDEKGFKAARAAYAEVMGWSGPDAFNAYGREAIAASIRAYLAVLRDRPAEPAGAMPVADWPKEIDERVLLYVVHLDAQYERDPVKRREQWESWFVGYWTDFNRGGWVWNGMAGTVTHVAPLPPRPDTRGANPGPAIEEQESQRAAEKPASGGEGGGDGRRHEDRLPTGRATTRTVHTHGRPNDTACTM